MRSTQLEVENSGGPSNFADRMDGCSIGHNTVRELALRQGWRRANARNVSQLNLYGVQHIQINLVPLRRRTPKRLVFHIIQLCEYENQSLEAFFVRPAVCKEGKIYFLVTAFYSAAGEPWSTAALGTWNQSSRRLTQPRWRQITLRKKLLVLALYDYQ